MSGRGEGALRPLVTKYSHLLHASGYVANHDGNISVRLSDQTRFLATPTAMSKREVAPYDLVIVDEGGKILSGRRRLFSEWNLHAACFRARPDVQVVMHAHPVHATALGLTRHGLGVPALPEMLVSLGANIPLLEYAMPKSPAQEKALAEALTMGDADAALLAGNGVIVVGVDLEQAFLRLELIEHYARMLAAARSFGDVQPLPDADVERLLQARTKAGLGRAGRN